MNSFDERLRVLGISDKKYPPGSMIYHKMTVARSPLNGEYYIKIDWSNPTDYREEIEGGKGRITGNTFYFPDTMTEKEAIDYMISHLVLEFNNDIRNIQEQREGIKTAAKLHLRELGYEEQSID